jgi:heptosyltransferase-1
MSSLGDVIHTLPLLKILKKNMPQADIDWVVNEEYVLLLKGNPYLNEVIPFKRKEWLSLAGFFKKRKEIKKFAKYLKEKQYDIVIDVQGLFKSAIVVMMAHGKRTIGFSNAREFASLWYDDKVEGDFKRHAVERYLQFAEKLGISWSKVDISFDIPTNDGVRKSLADKLNNLINQDFAIFCPFTRWETKRWDEENFYELEKLLNKENIEVVWVGAKGEYLKREVKHNLIGKINILELYELMKLGKFVVTCDSGAMHISASAGANIFALFGPTSPERTGPYNLKGKNVIIRKEQVQCGPCFDKTCKRKDKFCLNITPEEVLQIIKNSGLI